MVKKLSFHFEGALADSHRMNFYESARFQYAAARLIVKLAQFRHRGRFVKKITSSSNFDIQLVSQSEGSFNVNIETPEQNVTEEAFVRISVADLIAYVSERIIEKIDESTLANMTGSYRGALARAGVDDQDAGSTLDGLVDAAIADDAIISSVPLQDRELFKRRVAEAYRERRLTESQGSIARIDFARSQSLISMSAPLISDMATALRRSANTLEIKTLLKGKSRSVLFLDRQMAQDIETAVVDKDITPLLGDISQFNKDNGWGKLKIENGTKTLSFSIPSDILPGIWQTLVDKMKQDLVYLQTYLVRDTSGEVIRLIAVGVLPTPSV